ncbi:hypothetical protein BGW38_004261 [Lunasporangiospora selenospora]|uniref:NAD(P)-binding protein n=1 Tax=Lunasporangiospora selenospora TaxID=979761 RepID=A0A9P6FQB4_9FUNG|nr:hypothetical protein BGW38_004261 [Lunasporangiospora selenospora]
MPFCNVFTNPAWWKTFWSGNHFTYEEIPDLRGKVAIVTGGTGGLGYATVVALAAHGAHVFIASRHEVKAMEAIERAHADILQLQFDYPNAPSHSSGIEKPKIEYLSLDLSDMRKSHAAAREFLDRGLPLHILVNNGGIKNVEFEPTADGYENHFGVNHLGHFVFTTTLLVRESQPSRIVILSSMAHEIPPSSKPIDFVGLTGPKPKQMPLCLYGQSKLANLLFGKALARRLRNDRVWVNIAHPGCVDTQIYKGMRESDSRAFHNFSKFWLKLAYTAKEAALTQLYCATSPEIEEKDIRGRYFIPIANELRPNPISDDVDLQERLWDYSEKAAQGLSKV